MPRCCSSARPAHCLACCTGASIGWQRPMRRWRYLPLLYIATVVEIDRSAHPFEHFGSVVWPLAIATNLWILRRHEDFRYIGWWHAAALWLGVGVISWEVAWWLGELVRGGDVWRLIGWPMVPLALVAWLSDRGERVAWPVARYFESYLFHGGVVLAGFLWLWMLYGNFASRGDPSPLPYLPLLNPLDLAQGAALLTLFAWFRRMRAVVFCAGDISDLRPRLCRPRQYRLYLPQWRAAAHSASLGRACRLTWMR